MRTINNAYWYLYKAALLLNIQHFKVIKCLYIWLDIDFCIFGSVVMFILNKNINSKVTSESFFVLQRRPTCLKVFSFYWHQCDTQLSTLLYALLSCIMRRILCVWCYKWNDCFMLLMLLSADKRLIPSHNSILSSTVSVSLLFNAISSWRYIYVS